MCQHSRQEEKSTHSCVDCDGHVMLRYAVICYAFGSVHVALALSCSSPAKSPTACAQLQDHIYWLLKVGILKPSTARLKHTTCTQLQYLSNLPLDSWSFSKHHIHCIYGFTSGSNARFQNYTPIQWHRRNLRLWLQIFTIIRDSCDIDSALSSNFLSN